jgi:hypothetical protein
MTAPFHFNFTVKLPVYNLSVTGGWLWYGFSHENDRRLHWRDITLGPLLISLVHRRKYEAELDSEIQRLFGSGQNGIRVLRRHEAGTDDPPVTQAFPVDKDMLN